MHETFGELRPYVVQILHPLGTVEGTGSLCHPDGFVLTCWHVMESWGQLNRARGKVRFGSQELEAEWLVEKSDQATDLAVLKLTIRDDQETPYLPLDVHWRVKTTDQLESFGYPKGQFGQQGIATAPQLQGLTPTQVNGITVYPLMGFNLDDIDSGYSGAPVINRATQKVIGLVHAKRHKTQAFLIPLNRLFTQWPELRAFHDVYEHIRKRLGEQAHGALEEKLRAAPFIPLNLEAGHVEKKQEEKKPNEVEREVRPHGRQWERFDITSLLPPRGKFILSADVGTGKTTLVQWLAKELIQCTDLIPIVMACEELERLVPKTLEELLTAALDRFEGEFSTVDLRDACAEANNSKRLVFLFDGLDQILGECSAVLKTVFSVAGQCPQLITSRPSAINRSLERDSQLTFLRLQPFSVSDQCHYFGAHYEAAQAMCALAPDLTRVPMLAYMVRELISNGQLKQSVTRTELYEEFVSYILTEHDSNVALQEKHGLIRTAEWALGKLAFDALALDKPHIQRVPIDIYANKDIVLLQDLIAFGLVNRIIGRGEEVLYFTHQSFQEFLTAKYAVSQLDSLARILKERWHPKWSVVIDFVAGLQGESFVQRILSEPDNVIHSNLFLAARCAGETKMLTANLRNLLFERLVRLYGTLPFRCDVARALGTIGRCLERAQIEWLVRWLIEQLDDQNPNVSKAAAAAFDRLNAPALGAVVDRLTDKDPRVRSDAARALWGLGDRLNTAAIGAIVNRLHDESSGVRWKAAKALKGLGDRLNAAAIAAIVDRLRDEDFHVREAAVEALEGLGERLDTAAIAAIVDRLDDWSSGVRWKALSVLAEVGERLDRAAIVAIGAVVSDSHFEVRKAATAVLREFGKHVDATTVAITLSSLRDKHADVCRAAVLVLEGVGKRLDTATVATLVSWLRDKDADVRSNAAKALKGLGGRLNAAAIAAIVDCLHDESSDVRSNAAKALKGLGGRLNAAAIAAIVDRLRDEDFHVREAAVEALEGLGERLDTAAIGAIVDRLHDESSGMRWKAAKTLSGLGDRLNAATIAAIVDRSGDEDFRVREAAVEALEGLDKCLVTATVGIMVGRLRDKDTDLRFATLKVFKSLGKHLDTATIEAIVDRLCDKDHMVRWMALLALESVGERLDTAAIAAIGARLHDKDPLVRRSAIETIGGYGNRVDSTAVRKLADLLVGTEYKYEFIVYDTLQKLYQAGVVLPTNKEEGVRLLTSALKLARKLLGLSHCTVI